MTEPGPASAEAALPPVVSWWNVSCRSTMPFIRELAELVDTPVHTVLETDAGSREFMGWDMEDPGRTSLNVLPQSGWAEQIDALLQTHRDAFHLFGGYQRLPKLRYAIDGCIQRNIDFAILAEAPLNMSYGLKGWLKDRYLAHVLPRQARPVIDHARAIFCLSGKRFGPLEQIGWPIEKIVPFLYVMPDRGLQARQQPHPDGRVRLFNMGHLLPFKGVDVMVRAMAALKRHNDRFICHITGEGSERPRLEQMTRDLGLADHVHFVGFVSEERLAELMGDTDIMVCPGLAEPWGVRVNEAIQSGMAVVTSDRLGAADLVAASGAGRLFRTGDVGELAECLYELIERPAALQEAKRRALAYRPLISPASAGRHLLESLHYLLGHRGDRPIAPWEAAAAVGSSA